MSELKAYNGDVYIPVYGSIADAQVYLKDEADKVIAELKDDVTYWKKIAKKNMDDNVAMAKQRADAFKRERHHKYKRCLDQVENCRASSVYFFRISEGEKDEGKAAEYRRASDWFDKWEEHWLELAEKFKEAK